MSVFDSDFFPLQDMLQKNDYEGVRTTLQSYDRSNFFAQAQAKACLVDALHSTTEIFCLLLDFLEKPDLAGHDSEKRGNGSIEVFGTLLTLAAAQNATDPMKVLLERGYDPNGADLDCVLALNEGGRSGTRDLSFRDAVTFCTGECSRLSWKQGKRCIEIPNCTPLAAAILCGNLEATDLLLEQPGIWTTESNPVCRSIMAALRGDGRQKACVLRVLTDRRGEEVPDDLRFLLQHHPLRLSNSMDFCLLLELQLQYKHRWYTEEDARQFLQSLLEDQRRHRFELGNQSERDLALFSPFLGEEIPYNPVGTLPKSIAQLEGKLVLLAKWFPALCRERWAVSVFLSAYLMLATPENPRPRLLKLWKTLSNGVGDLTWAWRYDFTKERLSFLLSQLGEGMRLEVDADAVFFTKNKREQTAMLRLLLKTVHLRHTSDLGGISGFAKTLLELGNVRLMRQAMELGYLAQEPRETLLTYQKECGGNTSLRLLILMLGAEQSRESGANLYGTHGAQPLSRRHWSPDENQDWFSALRNPSCSKAECRAALLKIHAQYGGWYIPFDSHSISLEHPDFGTVQTNSILAAICCGGTAAALDAFLELEPMKQQEQNEVLFGSSWNIHATPMCLAAWMGHTDHIRLLLELGEDPDGLTTGRISKLQEQGAFFFDEEYYITPLLAALLQEQEETARLLLEAGAACDLSKPSYYQVLLHGDRNRDAFLSRFSGIGWETFLEKQEKEKKKHLNETRDWA